jgi:hypothetical protein
MNPELWSARTGPPPSFKNIMIFQYLTGASGELRNRGGGRLFCPAARFAVWLAQNTGWRDCLAGMRPILKGSF